jgi:hypothetical protein
LLCIGFLFQAARFAWSRPFSPREMVLLITIVLMAIPVLGPGYAPQYCYWCLPFAIIVYAVYPQLRFVLKVLSVVAAITFVIDYGLMAAYGFNLLYFSTGAHTPGELNYDLTVERTP